MIERQIHGARTLFVREPKCGIERVEPRDMVPPSPAEIAIYHLERAWKTVKVQHDRILSGNLEMLSIDFGFYVVAYRWLLQALKLAEATVEGCPEVLKSSVELRRLLFRMDIRNVLEHFDERERGQGPKARKDFPFIAESYGSGNGWACMTINSERRCLPEATQIARPLYLRARRFLHSVLAKEEAVRRSE
jgi:hypothetical protein